MSTIGKCASIWNPTDHSLHDSEKIVILSKLGFTFRIIVHFITCNSCFGFLRETYVERRKEESPNDRNDQAIRVAARYWSDPTGNDIEITSKFCS